MMDGIIVSKTKPEKCPVCGSKNLKQEEQVLDTWFSSWLWPISTLGWPKQTEEFKKYFPVDFEVSGPDIKYLWIARMIMSAKKFTGKIPFKNMFFHGTMRDLKGKKFSKSLGNGFEPMEMIEKWGTDSLRAALASYSVAARDIWVSRNTMDERCKNFRNFNNKIWNASRFVLMNLENNGNEMLKKNNEQIQQCHSELVSESIDSTRKTNGQILKQVQDDKNKEDLKILKHLNNLIKETTDDIENFKFHRALEKLYESFWHNFCDEYIETAKERLGNDDEKSKIAAQQTLLYSLKTYLKLLHPFIPFITEEIWEKIPFVEKHITVLEWPKEIEL